MVYVKVCRILPGNIIFLSELIFCYWCARDTIFFLCTP